MSQTAAPPVVPPTTDSARDLVVALAGNPNAGKTTIFNALTGMRQRVANYPGVTVERKEGVWPLASGASARLVDLPGLYSFEAASIDEQIARDVIGGRLASVPRPDVVVAVVDATNLERNLYLLTQILEMGRPVVVALSMIDVAERTNVRIDVARLSACLGLPVIPVDAAHGRGLEELARAVVGSAGARPPGPGWRLSDAAEREVFDLASDNRLDRAEAVRLLYGDGAPDDGSREAVEAARERLGAENESWWQEPVLARYQWIESIVEEVGPSAHNHAAISRTEKLDRILTHKIFGPVVLVLVTLLIFQTIFSWAQYPMDMIDGGFGLLEDVLRAHMAPGLLVDLLTDGIIKGVGGVLVFLPQILLLFLFIGLLEDSGYMARAAFLLDRLMRSFGLHGKAFLPLMSSFACAIPGIMATRTIENPKDRLATILVAPFMSCSARLPVYTLMIAAFFSGQTLFGFVSTGAVVLMAMYLLGILVAVAGAWTLKHTILKAPPPPLAMELPPYRLPKAANLFHTMLSRSWLFVQRAGTTILAISILLWVLVTFPRAATPEATSDAPSASEAVTQNDAGTPDPDVAAENAQLQNSYAGRLGHFIEPAIHPLGFDWQMGIGLIASFAAREVLVSTLSITYGVGKDSEAEDPSLVAAVRNAKRPDGRPAWTPLVALSMMVFFVLACQCMSTVAVVRRETNSWRWPLFMIGYMTALAYVASLVVFQVGTLLGFG